VHASSSGSIQEKEKQKEKEKDHHHYSSLGHRHKRTSGITSVGSSIASSTEGGRKKVGFLDKVRGEAKVIVGKIEHKEKVEERKRILRGED